MLAILAKIGAFAGIIAYIISEPAQFLAFLHTFVLVGSVILIILYIGGLKQSLNYLGIVLAAYLVLRVLVGNIEVAPPYGATNTDVSTINAGEYIVPVTGPVTSPFGPRASSPNGFHYGIDFACPEGTHVHASKAGKVIFAGYKGTIVGNVVELEHGDGTQTMYAHNSRVNVAVGDTVAQGDVIALSGNTGRSTGPHVHFEIQLNNSTSIDPAPHLNLEGAK